MDEESTSNENDAEREDFWEAWVKANISDPRKIAEIIAKKERYSETDELTSILNRRGVKERASQMEELMKRINGKWAIAFMDLDGLKIINDTKGHDAGDKYIINAAKALSEARVSDVVGRWGGDEFVVMLTLTDEENSLNAISRIQQKFDDYGVSCSIGVVENTSGVGVIEAIEKADKTMMEVKKQGLMAGERSGGVGVITVEL